MSVIPDSIDPVEGWKGWELRADGFLYSGASGLSYLWVPSERFRASCSHGPRMYTRWEPDTHPDGSEWPGVDWKTMPQTEGPPQYVTYSSMSASMVMVATNSTDDKRAKSPPDIELPEGMDWYFRKRLYEHACPEEGCTCGVYLASHENIAVGYGNVLGKAKGWGKVLEHQHGWRVEFAYPSELYVTAEQAKIIADYGVPLVLVEEEPQQKLARRKGRWWWWIFIAFMAAAAVLDVVGIVTDNNPWLRLVCALALALLAANIGFQLAMRWLK